MKAIARQLAPASFRLALCLAFILVSLPAFVIAQTPISGKPQPSLSPLDTIMQQLMVQYSSPGASLSVSVNGRLVYARGYGYADLTTGEFVQPDSLFRIASDSKPFTAAGILKLIEQGKLTLDTQPFASIFTDLTPPPGATEDPRLNEITIQELLEHTGGWDDTIAGVPDPVFAYEVTAATTFGDTPPATPEILISYMLGQPLQHDPGTVEAYSNFGYVVLGAVISRVSGESYTDYITNNVLVPAGIVRTVPGATFLSERLPYEVAYYDYPNAPDGSSVFPPVGSPVPEQYGGFSLELIEANGGWISSPMDLVRFDDNLNGQFPTSILASPPSGYVGYIPPYGPGWSYFFYGSLPGTNSLVHLDTTGAYAGSITWSAIFNTRSGTDTAEPEDDADAQIGSFLKTITSWPSGDLFSVYQGTGTSCAFSLATTSEQFDDGGGDGNVAVSDANYCAWSAISNSNWIHVTGGSLNSDNGVVSFTVDANGGSARTGTVSIAGQTFSIDQSDTAPSVALSPASLTFASQPIGSTSAAQTVTLTNSGNAALSVTSIAASGDFAETNTCGTSVAAAANCAISVTFAPSSGGALTGSLTITDSAANSPQTVSLNGMGSDVAASVNPTSLTIASAGGSATAQFQVSSVGGFSGAVNLTCSVAYQGTGTPQDAPTCSLNPTQAQVSSSAPATATLTVNSTAATGSSARLNGDWLPFGGSALAALFLFIGLPRRRWRRLGLLIALVALSLGIAIGCGGGSSSSSGTSGGSTSSNPGTTTGNYQVTVTATSASTASETMSINIPLSVQ